MIRFPRTLKTRSNDRAGGVSRAMAAQCTAPLAKARCRGIRSSLVVWRSDPPFSLKQKQCAFLLSRFFWPRLLSAPYGLATMHPHGLTVAQNHNLSPIVAWCSTGADSSSPLFSVFSHLSLWLHSASPLPSSPPPLSPNRETMESSSTAFQTLPLSGRELPSCLRTMMNFPTIPGMR